jgi:proteasome lid subunit RPN8/RPN11
MQALSDAQDAGRPLGAPYIHWHNERSPYAVELKAALVQQIVAEVAQAEEVGVETGGVLVGTFPRASELTVRIDGIMPLARRVEDGAEFVLTGTQRERFREAIRQANTRETSAVGFFRSQRGTSLALSDEDRRLSSEEFRSSVHLILLVGSLEPRFASISLSKGLHSPPEIAVPEFAFDSTALKSVATVHPGSAVAPGVALTTSLPEELATPPADEGVPIGQPPIWRETGGPRWIIAGVASVVLVIAGFAAGFIVRPLLPGSKLERELPRSAAALDLRVATGSDKIVQISWNHRAKPIYEASHGMLEIADGLQMREVQLNPDDLEAGSVAYEPFNDHLLVTMVLTLADGSSVSQSSAWTLR